MSNNANDGQRPKRTTMQGRRFSESCSESDVRREADELLPRLSSARLDALTASGAHRFTQARSAER